MSSLINMKYNVQGKENEIKRPWQTRYNKDKDKRKCMRKK